MKPRDRVFASIDRKPFDRHPIKHLAVTEVEDWLREYFGVETHNEVLDHLGDDFREIIPEYCGPDLGNLIGDEHGIYAQVVWGRSVRQEVEGKILSLAKVKSIDELNLVQFPSTDWFDYSTMERQCREFTDYARIFNYCGMSFINAVSGVRGYEQTMIDIAIRDPVYIELVERIFKFFCRHFEDALVAGAGAIDFVHLGEDFGSQRGLLISPKDFDEFFAAKYKVVFDLIHKYGAKAMMHICGSIRKLIPQLIDLGLDVLDVVQTNAVDMDLEDLKRDAKGKLTYAGTMCVQDVLPHKKPVEVRQEVKKRLELFSDGGLIIGPSHQLQVDTPLDNILAMYSEAGGLK